MNKLVVIPILTVFLCLIDIQVFYVLKVFYRKYSANYRLIFVGMFWLISFISYSGLFLYHFADPIYFEMNIRVPIMGFLFVTYFSKIFLLFAVFLGKIVGFMKWIVKKLIKREPQGSLQNTTGKSITRNEFLKKSAVFAAAIPFSTLGFGIINGVHNYRVIRKKVYLRNLPTSFHGLRIGQISDIHSGSFFDKKAVLGGVEMFLKEKADVIFFTGDLVNNETKEVNEYIDIFKKLKAPLGVFSILGNHDYGNYKVWSSQSAKVQNLKDMHEAHKLLGWKLLNNEHFMLESSQDKIAIIGVENWGTGRFPKYGKLKEACQGTKEASVKLLLSHDPSHWDAQIIPHYSDIDITFAGHTHGFQFGIETNSFKWSPSQYLYKQWAGLYQNQSQYLYVNRGFGFLGFPGRIGIEPEITIIELLKA